MKEFRDLDCERLITGALLTYPQDLDVYRSAGFSAGAAQHLITDGDLLLVWRAIEKLAAAGVTPDERTVRNELDSKVPAPFLSALVSGVPRLPLQNVAHLIERLSTLYRCRVFERGERWVLSQLAEYPQAINNGLLRRRLDELTDLQNAAPDVELLIDDVTMLQLPAPRCLIKDRLVAASLVALAGAPGIGKTFIATDLALSVATGKPWLGASVVSSGPVVYVAAEGVAGLQSRVRAWKQFNTVKLEDMCGFRLYPRALCLLDATEVETFLRATRRLYPVLIVFDTLARCMAGGDENSALDMGKVIAATDRIREATGATVMFLHHTTKAGGSERGSSALRGALDTLLLVNQTDDLLTLVCEKQKDAPAFAPVDLHLEQVDGTGSCVVQLAQAEASPASEFEALSASQRQCLRALLRSFPKDLGATSNQWMEVVPDLSKRTFYRARTVLLERGYVASRGPKNVWTGKAEPEGRI